MSSPPPSLVCITTSAALGGAETSLYTMLQAFRALEPDWRITVVVPGPGTLPARCRSAGFDVVELPFPAGFRQLGESAGVGALAPRGPSVRFALRALGAIPGLLPYWRALRRTVRAAGATVVHTNGVKAHLTAALIKPRGIRLVWHLHDYVRSRPLSRLLLGALAWRADAAVANSDSVRGDAASVFPRHLPLHRIYNAVDPDLFSPEGPPLDLAALSSLPEDPGATRIGLVATMARWKGHEVFIDAIASLASRHRVRAYVVGGPVYDTAGSQWSLEELRRRADAHRLAGVLGFTGHVDDVPGALRSLDIVVHASTGPEPFGMVIAEAMAAQRAVVAARGGGATELFEDGVSGIACEPGDAQALSRCLEALAIDASTRCAIGRRARTAALERFSPGKMARSFREVYAG